MHEKFLHYVWEHQSFSYRNLCTSEKIPLQIISKGTLNTSAGPDFFNCTIKIGSQKWAGNVEVHIKSSDWYAHRHETDPNYDNVILHIVWEHNAEIYRPDGTKIPVLELQNIIPSKLIKSYQELINSQTNFINCENNFRKTPKLQLHSFLERMYFERLEQKHDTVQCILNQNHNDWEATLFKFLLKYFGLNINGDAFMSIGNSIKFATFRKFFEDPTTFEAVLLGQAGLLKENHIDSYFQELKLAYLYQSNKHNFDNENTIPPKFFRLRPINFPTIRLSQFANLYSQKSNLFSSILEISSMEEIYDIFSVSTSKYWQDHFNFDRQQPKKRQKRLTRSFIDLLTINAILPVYFTYFKTRKDESKLERFIEIGREIPLEKNKIIERFLNIGSNIIEKNAMSSQALLQLKQNYCDLNRCIECAIGNELLKKNLLP